MTDGPRAIPASKLVIYVDEDAHRGGKPLYETLLHFLQSRGIAGATAIRGIAGYRGSGPLHTAAILRLSENLPLRIEAIDSTKKIDRLLPDLLELVGDGLVGVEPVTVYKNPQGRGLDGEAREVSVMKLAGRAKMLRIHIGDNDKWEGEPLYRAILNRAKSLDIAGATVYRAIEGYGAHRRRHKAGVFSSDAPISIVIIDEDEKIRKLLDALDTVVSEGCLIAISDVEVVKYTRHLDKTEPTAP